MGEFEFYAAGGSGLAGGDEFPGYFARRNAEHQGAESTQRNHSLEQAPNGTARTYVHSLDFEYQTILCIFLIKIDVVDAHHFASMNIDHLLVEQISAQEKLN